MKLLNSLTDEFKEVLRFASRRQWTLKLLPCIWILLLYQREVSFLPGWVSTKNLNLNNVMLQKKASLPEFIKGSYMVVLTFEFPCWWNRMVTIQINFLIRQYFNLLRFGFLHFTKWRSEILSNWLRQLLRVKGLHNTSFLQWNCLFNLCMFNRSAR